MIFIIIFITGLSVFQILYLKKGMKIIAILSNLFYLISTILTYFRNPGTVYRFGQRSRKKYCKYCNYDYPFNRDLYHCHKCGICVIGIDHHCGVFGKCIAKNNLIWFYCFTFMTSIIILFFLGTLVYILTEFPS